MDTAHGTNNYDFKLITVMAADQFGQGVFFSLPALYHFTMPLFTGRTVSRCIFSREERAMFGTSFKP